MALQQPSPTEKLGGGDLRIIAGVSWLMAFLLGFFGNIFMLSTITAILKVRKNAPNMLIFVLTMTDLLCVVVVYSIPGLVYIANRYMARSWLCDLQTFFLVFTNVQSMLLVLAIVIERYFAVAKPYLYQEHMTYSSKRLALFNIACLSMSMLLSLPTIIQNNHNNIVYFPGTFCMVDFQRLASVSVSSSVRYRVLFNVIFYIVVVCLFIVINIVVNSMAVCSVQRMTTFRQQHSVSNSRGGGHSEEYLFIRLCVVSCLASSMVWIPVLVRLILCLSIFVILYVFQEMLLPISQNLNS